MPLNPNFLERLVPFRLDNGPAPMLDLFSAMSLVSGAFALDMRVFETLADVETAPVDVETALTAVDLSEQERADPKGIATLFNFPVSEGYLVTADGGYRLTSMTETWLLESFGTNIGPRLTTSRTRLPLGSVNSSP